MRSSRLHSTSCASEPDGERDNTLCDVRKRKETNRKSFALTFDCSQQIRNCAQMMNVWNNQRMVTLVMRPSSARMLSRRKKVYSTISSVWRQISAGLDVKQLLRPSPDSYLGSDVLNICLFGRSPTHRRASRDGRVQGANALTLAAYSATFTNVHDVNDEDRYIYFYSMFTLAAAHSLIVTA